MEYFRFIAGETTKNVDNLPLLRQFVLVFLYRDIEKGKESIRLNTLFKVLGALNISVALNSPLMDRYKAGDDAKS